MKGSHDSSSDTSTDLTASDSGRGGSDVEMHHSSNAPGNTALTHTCKSAVKLQFFVIQLHGFYINK